MAASVPTTEPSEVTAGDTWTWRVSFTDYSSASFTLSYVLAGIDVLAWSPSFVTAQTDGSFLVAIPTSETAKLRAGIYRFVRVLSDGTTRSSTDLPFLNILADPATLEAGDAQPREERDLEVVRAAIAGRLKDGMQGYMIGGRQVQYLTPTELRKEEAILLSKLAKLRNGGQNPFFTPVRFEFTNASGADPNRQGWA